MATSRPWGQLPEDFDKPGVGWVTAEEVRARLFRRALRLFHDADRAEDAVSECILKTHGAAYPVGYHFTILRNLHKDFLRKGANREIAWSDVDPDLLEHMQAAQAHLAHLEHSPVDAMIEEWTSDRVYHLCRKIWPAKYLYALDLYWQYYSRADYTISLESICHEAGRNPAAVRSAFYRGCVIVRNTHGRENLRGGGRLTPTTTPLAAPATNGYSQNKEGVALDFSKHDEI